MKLIRWLMSLFRRPDYAAVTSKDARRIAIAKARSARKLEAMWQVWENQGVSKEGLLYAEVLSRKRALGKKLSATEAEIIRVAETRLAHGKSLKPITGNLRV